ncbi:MAG: hypothetical protein FWD58_01525, partial [Firmicutes bacterium]|nr:hypothetical protein [Bacillota bacterium]
MKKLCKALTAVILVASFAFVFAACFGDSFDPTELQNELNELKGKYGELQTKHDALQTELNTAKTDLNAAIADKQVKIDALQSDLTAKQTQINKLLADGTAAQEDIDALQSDLDDALADIDALSSELDALKKSVFAVLYLTYGAGNWDGGNATYNASNKVREGINYVELGEYPCTYVGDGMNTTLN